MVGQKHMYTTNHIFETCHLQGHLKKLRTTQSTDFHPRSGQVDWELTVAHHHAESSIHIGFKIHSHSCPLSFPSITKALPPACLGHWSSKIGHLRVQVIIPYNLAFCPRHTWVHLFTQIFVTPVTMSLECFFVFHPIHPYTP